jgi:hypothetical protein
MIAETDIAHVEQPSRHVDDVMGATEPTLAPTSQTLPSWLALIGQRQMPEEHGELTIAERHHAPWAEPMRGWPLGLDQTEFGEVALNGLITVTGGKSIVAGTALQRVIGQDFQLALQGQGGRPLFRGGERL